MKSYLLAEWSEKNQYYEVVAGAADAGFEIPNPLKPIGEGVQHVATEAGKAAENVGKAVGNALGQAGQELE